MLVVLSWWEQTASKNEQRKFTKWEFKVVAHNITEVTNLVTQLVKYSWWYLKAQTMQKNLATSINFKKLQTSNSSSIQKTSFDWFKIISYLLLGGTTHVCYSQPRWCFENSFATYNDIWGNTSRKFIRAWLNNKRAMAWKDWYFFRICSIINS